MAPAFVIVPLVQHAPAKKDVIRSSERNTVPKHHGNMGPDSAALLKHNRIFLCQWELYENRMRSTSQIIRNKETWDGFRPTNILIQRQNGQSNMIILHLCWRLSCLNFPSQSFIAYLIMCLLLRRNSNSSRRLGMLSYLLPDAKSENKDCL
jgi:hypothetical protein